VTQQRLAQRRGAVEAAAVHHHAGGVDRRLAIEHPPLAGMVEVFQRKPDRIHQAVAGRARWIGAVRLHALPQRGRLRLGRVLLEIRFDAWWRRRRRRSQHVLEHPLAAEDGRGAIRRGGDR
jgi:hypothetical protein